MEFGLFTLLRFIYFSFKLEIIQTDFLLIDYLILFFGETSRFYSAFILYNLAFPRRV